MSRVASSRDAPRGRRSGRRGLTNGGLAVTLGLMNPWHLTRSVRTLNRLRHIAVVLTQQGFGHIVARIDLARFLPVWMLHRKGAPRPAAQVESIGQRLRSVACELGPTFVKLGQMLSTRPDLLPDEILAELRSLQDEVAPFESELARDVIEADLGRSISECFKDFGDRPIASGSIGQVYRATLLDDREVVVKVRRPGIESTVEQDLQLLQWLAESVERVIPELAIYRPVIIVQEFEQVLEREMDFVHEASATARIGEAFAGNPGLRVPGVIWEFTSSRVLTLEAISGSNVESFLGPADGTGQSIDRPLIARRLVNATLDQIFEIGQFHADPHPGNILIEPPATVGLIDFGQTGTITPEVMTQLVIGVYAAVNREVEVLIDVLSDLGAVGTRTDRRELGRSLRTLLDKYHGLPLRYLEVTRILAELADVIRRHDVYLPREVIVLIKALGMVVSLASRLDPQMDVLALLRPRLRKSLRERFSAPRMARASVVAGWHLFSALRHLPANLREGMRRLGTGSWELNVRHENIDRLSSELDRSSNRLSFAVVIAAIIVGSSVVISADSTLQIFDIEVRYLGIVGYVVAGVLGLGLSWAIFRSGRLH